MSRALRELGLGPDADERAIKRAYAARLKTTRPDTDPEGFQALNAAYQAALSWVQSGSNAETTPTSIASDADADRYMPGEAPGNEPLSGAITQVLSEEALFAMLDAQPIETDKHPLDVVDGDSLDTDQSAERLADDTVRFDPDAFLDECIAVAAHGRDGELLDWLNTQPILWSLQHKAQIAQWLSRGLHARRPAIEARRFDVIAEFFGLLDLHSSYDAYVIQRLRHRMHLAWEVRTEQLRALAQRAGMDGSSVAATLRQTRRILKQLRRPLNTMQALSAGLVPTYPSAVRGFLHRLDFGNLDDLPPPIDPDQVAFWEAAGDRSRLSWQRLMVGASRCVAYALFAMMLTILIKPFASGEYIDLEIVTKSGLAVFVAMLSGWLTWISGKACLQWQCMPYTEAMRFRWLHLALIPILLLGAFLIERLLGLTAVGIALSTTAFLLALQRYRTRNGAIFGGRFALKIWHLSFIFLGVAMLIVVANFVQGIAPGVLTPGIAAFALALWAVDLRKQHASRRS
jgi:hypothetical protein